MSSLAGIVKQIAVATTGKTVCVELICANAYDAQIVSDDITSRLKIDKVFSLVCQVGPEVPERVT